MTTLISMKRRAAWEGTSVSTIMNAVTKAWAGRPILRPRGRGLMLNLRLTAKGKGATVTAPNKPTERTGRKATLYPFFSVKDVGTCVGQPDKATLADPKSCPNIGDHLRLGLQARQTAKSSPAQ